MNIILRDFGIVLTLQLQADFRDFTIRTPAELLKTKSQWAVCDVNLNPQESGNLIDVTTQFWQKVSIKISGRLEYPKTWQNTHHYNQWAEERDTSVDDRIVDQINRLEGSSWEPGKMKALISCMKWEE